MEKEKIVDSHIEKETNTEYAIYPKHIERRESALFSKSKDKLKKDGKYGCFICGCNHDLEVHHVFEWAFAESLDFQKIKNTLMFFDFYGYSNKMKEEKFESIDDIRNLLVLCKNHHRDELCGIHEITFPLWISQRVTKDGVLTVPQSEKDLIK